MNLKIPLTATAGFATAEPIMVADSGSEYDIQWMPPGYQEPQCFVGGKPRVLKFTCKAAHAERLNAQLQSFLAKANSGHGDKPLTDYNHEDGAASSRPSRIYWGGDDAKKGGIRLVGKWTAKARDGIRDGEWDRFSPEWQFDPSTFEPVSISPNLGGLVNRAAFKNIASVTARSSATGDEAEGSHAFIIHARAVALDQKIPFFDAVMETARANFGLYQDYVASSRPGHQPQSAKASYRQIGRKHPFTACAMEAAEHGEINGSDIHDFVARARAAAADQDVTFLEAAIQIAKANYALYQDWLSCFRARGSVAKAVAAQASAVAKGVSAGADHPFIFQAKAIADESKIGLTDAQARLATQNFPLYSAYLKTLRSR